jgi:hypothetical protein
MPNIINILIAAAAAAAASAPTLVDNVSSPLSDYNLSLDDAERMMVFARSMLTSGTPASSSRAERRPLD